MRTFMDQIRRCEDRFAAHSEQSAARSKTLKELREKKGGDWRKVDEPPRVLRRLISLGLQDEASEALARGRGRRGDAEFNPLERIINRNDLISSSFLVQGARCARSVGRVVIRTAQNTVVGFGTGFMVSPRLLLTNNHVLESGADATNSIVQFNFRELPDGTLTQAIEHRLEPSTFFLTDADLDFSLVAVAPINAQGHEVDRLGWTPLIAESGKAIVGERVNVIQHPGGAPQQIALRENQIDDVLDDFLHYSADTQQGSSGSPVQNDQWELAALHHAGVPLRDENGRILLTNGQVWDGGATTMGMIAWRANEGVRISRIVEHVRGRLPGLTPARRALFADAFVTAAEEHLPEIDRQQPNDATVARFGPRTDADGSAVWTVPVEIRVGLPGTVAAPAAVAAEPPGADAVLPADEPPAIDEDTQRRALARLAEGENRPYYARSADEGNQDAYYSNFPDNLSKSVRTKRLVKLLRDTHHTELSYRNARLLHLYPLIDLREDRTLRSLYSGKGFSAQEVIRMDLEVQAFRERRLREVLATESAPSEERMLEILEAIEAQSPFNCEHVVPQSWFAKAQPMKGDLHHLFTCESGCNSFRSNIPYFQFGPQDEAVREECGRRETAARKFEPTAGKGPAARATLYFLLRYPGLVGDENRELQEERLPVLLGWHEDDPVTDYERHRNAEIFEVQGNRNPLIDHPDWARKIDFESGFGD